MYAQFETHLTCRLNHLWSEWHYNYICWYMYCWVAPCRLSGSMLQIPWKAPLNPHNIHSKTPRQFICVILNILLTILLINLEEVGMVDRETAAQEWLCRIRNKLSIDIRTAETLSSFATWKLISSDGTVAHQKSKPPFPTPHWLLV